LPDDFVDVDVILGACAVDCGCVDDAKCVADVFAHGEQVAVAKGHRDYGAHHHGEHPVIPLLGEQEHPKQRRAAD
jgi:hypothetical protein